MSSMEHPLTLALPQPPSVPAPFAEKAMASLMQLHGELMEEKERRVDLYRRLMEREQALAELKLYVRLLEEKVAASAAPPVTPGAEAAAPAVTAEVSRPQAPGAPTRAAAPPKVPPVPPRAAGRAQGWKVW